MSINANDFVGQTEVYAGSYWSSGTALAPFDVARTNWGAPLNLPHGARIDRLVFFWWNSAAIVGQVSRLELYRSGWSTELRTLMADVSAGASAGKSLSQETTIAYDIVDNHNFTYFLLAYLPSPVNRLLHVEIYYWD